MENKEANVSGGIEFLKSIGIKEVSNRTFIHEDELKKFLDGDFHGINKTKAMGFIQILEREFNIDLSDLKAQYINYLNEHKNEEEEPKQSLIMEEVQSEERKKGILSFLFLVAAIGSIAYVIDKYNLLDFSNPTDIKTAQVIDSKEVKTAKLNLEKLTQPEEKKSQKQETSQEDTIVNNVQETKNSDENNLDLGEVLQNEEDKNQPSQVEEQTQSQENNQGELDLSKLNEELKDESATNDENLQNNDENLLTDENNASKKAISNEIYIIPNSKVWIGTIDLDTLKKKDFLAPKGKRVDIDGSTDKLIMIGHKFIKIYLNGNQVKFKRRGPVRFKYVDGQLIEINRKEFNKLAKGRQW